ncbi:MAG: hypothetical protein A2X59_10945 [Nitrospirae bacterium GWC2_42_7]|nr:MAG: hypothetical protein A2X59_10945 [Nitrospirae bacterium GWC2_42_7]
MKNVMKTFDAYAEQYDSWFDSPEGKALFDIEVNAIKTLMKDIHRPFLEIGVGTGRFAEKLGIGFGVDPSPAALSFALKRGIITRKAEGEKLPYQDKSFGAVFLLFTLCFVKDVSKVLSEAKRVLKEDGRLIIGIINRDSVLGRLYMKKKAEGHPIYKHAHFYRVNELAKLIVKAGMTAEAYSSALCRTFPARPFKEDVHSCIIKKAGFVCVRSRKIDRGEKNGG